MKYFYSGEKIIDPENVFSLEFFISPPCCPSELCPVLGRIIMKYLPNTDRFLSSTTPEPELLNTTLSKLLYFSQVELFSYAKSKRLTGEKTGADSFRSKKSREKNFGIFLSSFFFHVLLERKYNNEVWQILNENAFF